MKNVADEVGRRWVARDVMWAVAVATLVTFPLLWPPESWPSLDTWSGVLGAVFGLIALPAMVITGLLGLLVQGPHSFEDWQYYAAIPLTWVWRFLAVHWFVARASRSRRP